MAALAPAPASGSASSPLAAARLASLRAEVARIERAPRRAPAADDAPAEWWAATGVAAVDALLGGGLPRGRLTELVGRRSAGRTSLALAAIAAATARGEAAALLDVDGALDAGAVVASGVVVERLLWVRARDGKRGLQGAELVMAAGGFGLVVLDLGDGAVRAPDAAWLRLARAAERAVPAPSTLGTALVVVSAWPSAKSFAAVTLEARRARPAWQGAAPARYLAGVSSRVELARSKLGAPGGGADVEWQLR